MKPTITTTKTRTVTKAVFSDFEIELEHKPDDCYSDVLCEQVGDKLVVGYLVHDDDCSHPLDDCDGMGKIIGRGEYETRNHSEHEMFEALGLDRNGDTNFELVQDEVNAAWEAYLGTVSDDTWFEIAKALGAVENDGPYTLREVFNKIRDELITVDIFNEGSVLYAIASAGRYMTCVDPTREQMTEAAKLLDFDPNEVMKVEYAKAWDAGKIGDRDAVLLDVYDHSGIAWSLHGGGTQCRWDTSGGAGVWVPDDCAREEIDRRAPIYAHAWIRATNWMPGRDKAYDLFAMVDGLHKLVESSDDWSALWAKAQDFSGGKPADATALALGRRRAARELAAQAVEEYNSWLSGDCYGCVVETFKNVAEPGEDPKWEQVDSDACWGYVGSDWAQKVLREDYFGPAVKALQTKE